MSQPLMFAALALVCGCVDKGSGPQPKKIEPGYVPGHLLAAAPEMSAKLDVTLGGKVVYLGNNVDQPRVIPGKPFTITHYWKVIAPVGEGWGVFSMVHGVVNTTDFMSLLPTDMQRAHKPETWRAGEIIEDVQELALRADWKSPSATLDIGLIPLGAHGQGDRMAAAGTNVEDRAVIARVLEVDVSKAPPPAGTVYVPYARGAITIDGKADDPGWTGAVQSPELLAAEGGPEPVGRATARMTWDDQNLYLFVSINDTDIFSEYKNQDDPLWKADAVEIFIDADGNKRGYVELQVNPNNATFDSWFPAGRAPKGDEEWDSGMVTAVQVRGTADQAGDTDIGWDVEVAIPWAAVKGRDAAMAIQTPPKVGDRWKLNVVRVDYKTGTKGPSPSSWNRIGMGDFHALDRMLTAVFASSTGEIRPGSAVNPLAGIPPADPSNGSGAGSGSSVGAGSGSGNGSATSSGSAAGSGSGSGAAKITSSPMPGAGSGSAAKIASPTEKPAGAGSGSAAKTAAPVEKPAGAGSGSAAKITAPAEKPAGSGSAAKP